MYCTWAEEKGACRTVSPPEAGGSPRTGKCSAGWFSSFLHGSPCPEGTESKDKAEAVPSRVPPSARAKYHGPGPCRDGTRRSGGGSRSYCRHPSVMDPEVPAPDSLSLRSKHRQGTDKGRTSLPGICVSASHLKEKGREGPGRMVQIEIIQVAVAQFCRFNPTL